MGREHGGRYANHQDRELTQPWGMNNKGEIVGGYVDSQGMLYGFYAKATP
jgi:hypothetical protein